MLKLEANKLYKKRKKIDYTEYLGDNYDKSTKIINEERNTEFRNTIKENNKPKSNNRLSWENNTHKDKIYFPSLSNNYNKKFNFETNENKYKIKIADSFELTSLKSNNNIDLFIHDENKVIEKQNILFSVGNIKENKLFCNCEKFPIENQYYSKICKNFDNYNLSKIPEDIYLIFSLKYEQSTNTNKEIIEKELSNTNIKDKVIFNKILKILWSISASTKLGYIKGMNYICYALLYHMEEELVYFFFLDIFKKLDLSEIYKNNSQEISIHIKNIKILFENQTPDLNNFLENNKVDYNYFLYDWIITLCTKFIPIKFNKLLLNGIFNEGWIYVYRVIQKYYKEILNFIKLDLKFLKQIPDKNINWSNILI